MLGMLLGSLFSSQISDWYGRKWVYLGVCLLMGLGQVLSALAPDPISYAFARFMAGAGLSGTNIIHYFAFVTPLVKIVP
jgi:MFS family permease